MGKKVVVCDDDEGVLEVLSIMLEGAGYKVKLFSNGKGILKKIKQYNPALIFLDIWMPGVGGVETTKLLKADPATKDTPVIIVSALHENEVKKLVKQTGADGYISKPFDMDYLLEVAKKYTN